MHLKTVFAVILLVLGLGAFAFGVLAALGISINLDLTSPGPINTGERPTLERVETTDEPEPFRFSN